MTPISQNKMHGGTQYVYSHKSEANQCEMRVAVFIPPQAKEGKCPALVWLSGLTCTEENFTVKAGAQRMAAELGLIMIAPDTSPRGDDVPDKDDQYDFGKGAGFYLNATEKPWAKNFQMETYIRDELTAWMCENFPIDGNRIGISGHSMGGHGALTLHLKNPSLYKTCSAFSPIVAPMQVPWGQKALSGYLGDDTENWTSYDAVELVKKTPSGANILIDQGLADNFLQEQLQPELFEKACAGAGQKLSLRLQDGYDHSYFFIASFIEDHLRHHAKNL
ncbi:MAG: S-formylglutathione hydrolase [Robiginitomaculum sp.]|nr:MAG: S-formylglutathione hydrolase [Robiginitomaculum sp.]